VKRILYSSGAVVTGDSIADAVIEYAQELARLETSATVDIPVVIEDGTIHEAQLLLGPASQLATVDAESGTVISEAEEAQIVDALRHRIARLHPRAAPIADVDLSATDPYDN
jgi:hypothetical protein